MSSPFILVPKTVTDTVLISSTLAEPGTGEVVWNAATNYVVGQRAIVIATHSVYDNLIAGINATSPELALTGATPRWRRVGPTNKWAAYDGAIDTKSRATSLLQYVLRPGIFTAIAVYGAEGGTVRFVVRDAPGGTVVIDMTQNMFVPAIDMWDYRFGGVRQLTKAILKDVVPYADPEVTITIEAGGGGAVAVGMIAIGDLRALVTVEGTGGTEYGAAVKPISFNYVAFDDYGQLTIKRRPSTTGMTASLVLPLEDADKLLATVQEVLGVPVAIIASDLPLYDGLNIFGLVSAEITYKGPTHAGANLDVRGII